MKYKLLYEVIEKGEAALPNLYLYYKAAAVCWIRDWIKQEDLRLLELEGYDMSLGWHSILWPSTTSRQTLKVIKKSYCQKITGKGMARLQGYPIQ